MAINERTSIVKKSYPTFLKNIKQYFHTISLVAIITLDDGTTTTIDLSDVIFNFKIFQLYDAFVFPVVAVSVNLTLNQHTTIADNLERTQFRLNIDKVEVTEAYDISKAIQGTKESVYKDLMLELSDYDKKRFRDESEQYNGGFEDAVKVQVYMELFKAEHLAINKKPINGIYNDVDMDSLLVHLLTKSRQKMLIQNSDRTERLKQVLLPSKNLVQTIYYLQDVYGIYKAGLRLFFDFDRGYCLTHDVKNSEPISEKEPFEYKNVVCYIGKSATEASGCWLDEETKTYYMLMPNSDNLEFADKSAKDLYGNTLVFQSSNQDKKTVELNTLENSYRVENSSNEKTVLSKETVTKDITYTVKPGDTLSDIAKKHNVTVAEIIANNNNIYNPNLIYPNQLIKIPITTTTIVEKPLTLSEAATTVLPDNKGGKVKYYYNNFTNNYAEDELLSLINRNELKYLGNFKNVDTTFLTMNKIIYLSFLDESYSDYNGMYEIEGLGIAFTKIGKNVYETDHLVSFARLTKDYLSFS